MFTVQSARDLGPQFVDNPHRIVGMDGAFSIPLKDDVLWFFGDTLIGRRVPGESLWFPGGVQLGPGDMSGHGSIDRMINNSALLLKDHTGREGLNNFDFICHSDGSVRTLIPLLPDENPDQVRVWCQNGCRQADQLYLFFIKVRMKATGPLPVNFEILGSGLATGPDTGWRFERVMAAGSYILWGAEQPKFAVAILPVAAEKRVYLYGVKQGPDQIQRCYLARVPQDKIADISAYEYLCAPDPAWSPDVNQAVSLFDGMPNEMSISYNPYLGCYLAVHSLDLSGLVVGRTAPTPWGPWSEPQTLWQVQVTDDRPIPYDRLIYAGKEHPTLSEQNGRILYLTYIEFEEYFPHLVEITLE